MPTVPVPRPLGRLTRRFQRRLLTNDALVVVTLSLLTALLVVLHAQLPRIFIPTSFALVLMAGGFLLRVRSLLLLIAMVAGALAVEDVIADPPLAPGAVGVVLATATLALAFARSRAQIGVQGMRGQSMLVDLRDRLRAQAQIPQLPQGWEVELEMRSANGASFSGDFVIAARDGDQLELVVVDVSGKGLDAGTRALMLSGAYGGLLGSLPPEQFLPAANVYLLRQRWAEGFATAVHLVIDVRTGRYVLTLAGHPAPAQFHAGSGRWRSAGVGEGPLLGVLPRARYTGESGVLGPGDALLLVTDGLIEIPGEDLSVGVDRLLGHAEALVCHGFAGGAKKLLESVGATDDDRTLLLLWRH